MLRKRKEDSEHFPRTAIPVLIFTLKIKYVHKEGENKVMQCSKTKRGLAFVLAVFMLRFFLWYGVAPSIENCYVCGNETPLRPRFSPEGMLCGDHPTQSEHMAVSTSGVAAIHYILTQPLASAFQFNASPTTIHEIQKAALILWRHHFHTELRSYSQLY